MQTIPTVLGQNISKEAYFSELKTIRESYKKFLPYIFKYHPFTIDPYAINPFDIMTPLELQFWASVRLFFVPFYPQFPVGKYFIDFADPVEKTAIEIDGSHHLSKEQFTKDQSKNKYLMARNWTVYRFDAWQVYSQEMEEWVKEYREYLLYKYEGIS